MLTKTQIDDIAESILDELAARVQTALGVATGDAAGVFFSDGLAQEKIAKIIRAYSLHELVTGETTAGTVEVFALANMDAWSEFVDANCEALIGLYGSVDKALHHARDGGLMIAGE